MEHSFNYQHFKTLAEAHERARPETNKDIAQTTLEKVEKQMKVWF